MKRILLVLGHTASDSYSGRLADAYESGARSAGHEVVRVNLGDLRFDPVLREGYRRVQDLEPDLKMVQEHILWADHLVFVYPNWWCTMPALLKGLFDRIWLPGFAFNFDKQTKHLIKRLTGKTGRVVIAIGTQSPFMTWWRFGDFTNEISHAILGFAGVKTSVTAVGPSDRVTPDVREGWVEKVRSLGARGR
ncbi:MAG TPA: NAD(P)H-dependent oxidoreductase [Candidatus Paceibacterota bacterium]|nr:NAD(P)H-dependent oxidoreductase [Candidatus Paceibacterota bacterium]